MPLEPNPKDGMLIRVDVEDQLEGMGVLEDGTPYLTTSGLAKMCGVNTRTIARIYEDWDTEKTRSRGQQIQSILSDSGYNEDAIHISVTLNNQKYNVIPDAVCMAILEYYAFISNTPSQTAQHIYRILARVSFREYVYRVVGYKQKTEELDKWKQYHDRVSLVAQKVPNGYFSIFNEISSMVVDLITAGLPVNDKIVPDISVGKSWGSFWSGSMLDSKYGARIPYEHNYPEYFAQAGSNPQNAWAYPDTALACFRAWFRSEYLVSKYPAYIQKQADKLLLPEPIKNVLTKLYCKDQIESN